MSEHISIPFSNLWHPVSTLLTTVHPCKQTLPSNAHKKPRSSSPLAVTGFHFAVGLLLLWPVRKQIEKYCLN